MSTNEDLPVERDDDAGRFVLADASDEGYIEVEQDGGRLTLIHTEVAQQRQGEGVGCTLVRTALADAERRGLTVVPECDFVACWLDRTPTAPESSTSRPPDPPGTIERRCRQRARRPANDDPL